MLFLGQLGFFTCRQFILFFGQLGFFGPNLCFFLVIIHRLFFRQPGKRDRIEHILLDYRGQFIIFLEGGGTKIAYFGANWKFTLCTHMAPTGHRPRLGSSLHVLLLRFSHVFFLLLFFSWDESVFLVRYSHMTKS